MEKKNFSYKKRDPESVKHRAATSGFSGEGYLKAEFKTLKMEDRVFNIRILPPTWEEANHYGKDVWLHRDIGIDKSIYLCNNKMFNEPCPICEERLNIEQEGNKELADKLKPSRRVLMWVIDRKDEKVGPQIFSCPPTLDTNFCKLSVNNKTNEVLCIDDPDEGYDIEFERIPAKGKDGFPNYIAPNIDRRSSPLGDEENANKWLEFIVKNPLPSIIIKHNYDHIKKNFEGVQKNIEVTQEEFTAESIKQEIKQESNAPIVIENTKQVSSTSTEQILPKKILVKDKKDSILASIKTKAHIDSLTKTQAEEVCEELGFSKTDISNSTEIEMKEAIFVELESKLEKEEPKDDKINKLKEKLKALRMNS